MTVTTGLKDSLQEIATLTRLLRSDLRELAAITLEGRRGSVLAHIRWIADRFEQLTPGLAAQAAKHAQMEQSPEANADGQAEPPPAENPGPDAAVAADPLPETPDGPTSHDDPKHRGRHPHGTEP